MQKNNDSMTQEEINGGNRLIIEFMGWRKHSGDVYWFPNLYPSEYNTGETTFHISEARFHTSWDWLMPVAEEIKNLHENNSHKGHLSYINITNALADVNIESTWLAVVDFIEWHK